MGYIGGVVEIYNGPVAYLVVVFACSTIAQYWCHDHHDHCDHHGHDCHDQYWYHDRLTPFRGNCRLCFTWFQPIAGFWLLSLLLIIGSHCVSFSIPQQQPFNMKKKNSWQRWFGQFSDHMSHHWYLMSFSYLCFWHFFSGHDEQSGHWPSESIITTLVANRFVCFNCQ